MKSPNNGLLHACLMDGKGGGKQVGWNEIRHWQPDQGSLWVHLGPGTDTAAWIQKDSGLKPNQAAFLLQEEGRPRLVFHPKGLLITLRGVNHQEGAKPGDMIFLNAWVETHRIITYAPLPVLAVEDLYAESQNGQGALESADVLLRLAEHLTMRMGPILDEISGRLDLLEEELSLANQQKIRKDLGDIRRLVIRLHLHIEPQRTMLLALLRHREGAGEPREDKKTLQEIMEQVSGYLERLDAYRDHAGVIRDELDSIVSQQMNQALYILSVISGLLLPMGLLTGLLGINVGGMPGAATPWAFWAVCLLLVAIGGAMAWMFRRLKFI